MALTPGSILRDRYLIKEPLGSGGMGTVYLAEDQALDQLVAVKSNHNPDEESTRQFEIEARLLAKLRHPNLPLVFDHFIIDDVQYLVMDYIPGTDLNQRIKVEGPQAIAQVLEWAGQISSALSYLHSQDPPVVHRDIKPANLKITPSGQVVLVDFGIAKATSEQTTVGARGYTPGYAPPEQYGGAITGPYSDQYSFAATLYALLTGGPPPESVDLMLGEKTLAPTRSYSKQIPLHVDQALQVAMAAEPDKRFASVKQFYTALTDPAALADFTMMPGTDTIVSDSALPDDGSEAPTIAASEAALPTPAKKKRSPWVLFGILGLIVLVIGGGLFLSSLFGNQGDAFSEVGPSPTDFAAGVVDEASATPEEAADVPLAATDTPAPTDAPPPTPTFTATVEPTAVGGGGKIAFVSNREGPYDQIFVMDPDGSNVTQLTFGENHKSWPVWSPDGTKILFTADAGRGTYGGNLANDIFVMNADGTNMINLTQNLGNDEDAIWSPDGSKIVFVSFRWGGTRQLAVMNADGTEVERVSGEFEEYNPTFSPDGNVLLFASTFFFTLNARTWEDPNLPQGLSTVYDMDPALWDDRWDETDRIGKGDQPAWSPDGNWIVYIRTQGNNRRVYLVDANSEGATVRHLDAPPYNYDPAWSPDSSYIVFTNSSAGNLEIWTMDQGGRFQTNLTNHPADDQMPSWQPLP